MARVRVEACQEGFERARRQIEVSRLVLEHDLQRRLVAPVELAP
jgi:hypothetical protein